MAKNLMIYKRNTWIAMRFDYISQDYRTVNSDGTARRSGFNERVLSHCTIIQFDSVRDIKNFASFVLHRLIFGILIVCTLLSLLVG